MSSAHKRLVKRVMDALEKGIEDEELDCEGPASLAIEIVAAIMREDDWLLCNSEVRQVLGITQSESRVKTSQHTAFFQVQVVPDVSGLCCQWCRNPYGKSENGAPHQLCRNCYQYGPPSGD